MGQMEIVGNPVIDTRQVGLMQPMALGKGTPSGRTKVLLIDDDPLIIEVMADKFDSPGLGRYQLITAGDGRTALGLFQREKPPVVLIDRTILGDFKGGDEIAKSIREDDQRTGRKTHIILVSADNQRDYSPTLFDQFMLKLCTNAQLADVLGKAEADLEKGRRIRL